MKTFLLFPFLLVIHSCGTITRTADSNTCGVVISYKELKNKPGMEYLVLVNQEQKDYWKIESQEKFNVGDTICHYGKTKKFINLTHE